MRHPPPLPGVCRLDWIWSVRNSTVPLCVTVSAAFFVLICPGPPTLAPSTLEGRMGVSGGSFLRLSCGGATWASSTDQRDCLFSCIVCLGRPAYGQHLIFGRPLTGVRLLQNRSAVRLSGSVSRSSLYGVFLSLLLSALRRRDGSGIFGEPSTNSYTPAIPPVGGYGERRVYCIVVSVNLRPVPV